MEHPYCFVDGKNQAKVCRLNKALFGLKQSNRVWNTKLDAAQNMGLESIVYGPCVYYRIDEGNVLFVSLYVDDVLIFTNCKRWKKK